MPHGTGPVALSPPAKSVIYNGVCHHFGDWQSASQNDYHCSKPASSSASTLIWYLDLSAHHMGGDTVQIGTASAAYGAGPHHIYIAGRERCSYSNLENVVDIKTADDIVISTICGHSFLGCGSGSSGTGLVVHNQARRVWVLNSEIYDSNTNFSVTDGEDIYFIGNVSRGASVRGMEVDGATGVHIINNSFDANNISIQARAPGVTLVGNIFGTAVNCDVQHNGGTTALNAWTWDYNLYESVKICTGSNAPGTLRWDTLRKLQGGTSDEANGRTGSPAFMSEADLNIGSGSPAIDNGIEHAVYGVFETTYGLDIRKGQLGVARPVTSGDWDIGAFERSAP